MADFVFPRATTIEQRVLALGELFVWFDSGKPVFGMATGIDQFCVLGPSYPDSLTGPAVVQWDVSQVVNFGHNYVVILPTDISAWYADARDVKDACLAIAGDKAYLRADVGKRAGLGPKAYVEIGTGKVEYAGVGQARYTRTFDLVAFDPAGQKHTYIAFPVSTKV